jgi:hypothetical protein
MRYFPLLDFQTVILLIFIGLIVLLLLYIAFSGHPFLIGKKEGREKKEEFPEGIQTTNRPIPLLLIFVYAGFIIWALVYVIVIGLRGGPF